MKKILILCSIAFLTFSARAQNDSLMKIFLNGFENLLHQDSISDIDSLYITLDYLQHKPGFQDQDVTNAYKVHKGMVIDALNEFIEDLKEKGIDPKSVTLDNAKLNRGPSKTREYYIMVLRIGETQVRCMSIVRDNFKRGYVMDLSFRPRIREFK